MSVKAFDEKTSDSQIANGVRNLVILLNYVLCVSTLQVLVKSKSAKDSCELDRLNLIEKDLTLANFSHLIIQEIPVLRIAIFV